MGKEVTQFGNLVGVEKAATLLLSLSEAHLAKIFEVMDDLEIREISQAMSRLGKINSDVVEQLIETFNDEITSTGALVGSYESTERLLKKALPKDKVEAIMEEIRGPAGRTMWEKLGNVSHEVLANFLKNEYPQTIAVVLSQIKTDHASRVISQLPEHLAMEVILRMLRMDAVQKDVLDDVERTLKTEFMTTLSRANSRDSYELVAEMFNFFDRSTSDRFMSGLEERSEEDADKVKSLMFTFDDLQKLDSQGIQAVLRVADKSKIALALKGANDDFKALFFKNMSERAGKFLKEEMDGMGMVRVKDVEEAQGSIVTSAKALIDKGEIILNSGDDGDELVG